MKNIKKLLGFIVIFFILLVHTGCFKEAVDYQVRQQNILLSPQATNECWRLIGIEDKEKVEYFMKYYKHSRDFNVSKYGNTVQRQQQILGDYRDLYKIDRNVRDCEDLLYINESDYLFFKAEDFRDFGKLLHSAYDGAVYSERDTTSANSNNPVYQRYYYEELYFEPEGRFRKKIFFDNACNFITISGYWRFNTPFSKSYAGEIMLFYDTKNIVGVQKMSDIYELKVSDNFLSLSQKYKIDDSSFVRTRGHYTIINEYIRYDPANSYNSFYNGKIETYSSNVCPGKGKLEIYDPLTFVRRRSYESQWRYSKATPRCTSGTTPDLGVNTFKISPNVYTVTNIRREDENIIAESARVATDSGSITFIFFNAGSIPGPGTTTDYKVVNIPTAADEVGVSVTHTVGNGGTQYDCTGTDNVKATVVNANGKISIKMPTAVAKQLGESKTTTVSADIVEQ